MPSTPTPQVALLRGVNVGGKARVPMAPLRAALEDAGLHGVRTYLQSGNILLGSAHPDPCTLIAATLRTAFDLDVPVISRTAREWHALSAHNPYAAQADADPTKVHVAFLPHEPAPADVQRVRARPGVTWEAHGRELYVHTPDGMGRSDVNLGPLNHATLRNWRTVQAIAHLLR